MFQESVEELPCRRVGKAHEFFDDRRIVFTQDHIEIVEVADLRDRVACSDPVQIDQERFSSVQKYVSGMKIAVGKGVDRRKRVDQLHAPFCEGFIFISDSGSHIAFQPFGNSRETVIRGDLDAVDQVRQIGHGGSVFLHLPGTGGNVAGYRLGVYQLIHSPVLISHRLDAEGDNRGQTQNKGLAAERDFLLHITVGVLAVENLDDGFIIIAVDIAFVPLSDELAAVDGDLFVFDVPALLGIKGSGPDGIDVLDKLLERSGPVELQFYDLCNALVIPAVHGRIVLIELLPDDLALFRVTAREGADVGELVRKPQHPNAYIPAALQFPQGLLLAAFPGRLLVLPRIFVFGFRGNQLRHAPAEPLFDLAQRSVRVLHNVVQDARGNDFIVIRHR